MRFVGPRDMCCVVTRDMYFFLKRNVLCCVSVIEMCSVATIKQLFVSMEEGPRTMDQGGRTRD